MATYDETVGGSDEAARELSTWATMIDRPPRRLVVRVFGDGNIEIRAFVRDEDGNYPIAPADTLSFHKTDVGALMDAVRHAVQLSDGLDA